MPSRGVGVVGRVAASVAASSIEESWRGEEGGRRVDLEQGAGALARDWMFAATESCIGRFGVGRRPRRSGVGKGAVGWGEDGGNAGYWSSWAAGVVDSRGGIELRVLWRLIPSGSGASVESMAGSTVGTTVESTAEGTVESTAEGMSAGMAAGMAEGLAAGMAEGLVEEVLMVPWRAACGMVASASGGL